MACLTVLGSAGGIGGLFVQHLSTPALPIVGVDLRPQPRRPNVTTITCDAAEPDAAVRAAIADAVWVIVCLPERDALRSLARLGSDLRPGALLVDTLSVKGAFTARALTLDPAIELLGVALMFAPDRGFAGQKVAIVPARPGPRADTFMRRLTEWGARLAWVSADEHDHLAAQVQAATHAALLAFGGALVRLGYDARAAARMSTPPHRALLALLARIVESPPEVYWDVQCGNPKAREARRAVAAAAQAIDTIVASGQRDAFDELLQDLRTLLGPDLHAFASSADIPRSADTVGLPER
jgi:prephenate dehydrogenase